MKLIDRVKQAFDYFNSFRLEELKEDDVYYIDSMMEYIEKLEAEVSTLKKETKQTAVEFLAKSLKDFPHIKHSFRFKELVEQAKAMEKEQIVDAHYQGYREILKKQTH